MEKISWKGSFNFNEKQLMKLKNGNDNLVNAMKNSLVIFAQNNVKDSELSELVAILDQIKTTKQIKQMAQEAYTMPSSKAIFASWQEIPVWASRDPKNNLHVVLDNENASDFSLNHNADESPEEGAWETVDNQIENWLARV